MISRLRVMQAHMLLAGFFLPIAIIYFVSGALYTLDIKGHVKKQEITLQLSQPFTPDLERLTALTRQSLVERELPLPGGEATLRKKHGAYELRWDDLANAVTMVSGRDIYSAILTVRERSPLTQIMRIHRAEAGTTFKVLAVIMAAGLVIIFSTGVFMARTMPKLRRPIVIAIVSGVGTFLALLLLPWLTPL